MQPIPRVDPVAPKHFVRRTMEGMVATTPGAWVHRNTIARVEPALIKATGGKLRIGTGPRVNLTVPGRKSGQLRTTTLIYFTRGEEVIVIPSNFGGERYPAWYLNLTAARECELEWQGGSGTYLAREADEPERTALFELAKQLYDGYAIYEKKTAGIRKIPVMILSPKA